MRRHPARSLLRLVCGSLVVSGCSSLIGLSSLDRVSCLDDCDTDTTAGAGAVGGKAGRGPAGGSSGDRSSMSGDTGSAGEEPNASGGAAGAQTEVTAGAGAGGTSTSGAAGKSGSGGATGGAAGKAGGGGTLAGGAGGAGGKAGAGGAQAAGGSGAGGAAPGSVCPGGVAPAPTWQEHWFEHTQKLTPVSYDDCAATYFDADMAPGASSWLSPFVSKVWQYSLRSYGVMGPKRVRAIFHQGKYIGGHSATFRDASHDNENVIDSGATDWTQNYSDPILTRLSYIVETTAAHTKFGSPASKLWGPSRWQQFFIYDVYVGLGLSDQAAAAFNKYNVSSVDYPRVGSFWFRDWFYPLWRDHGHAQVLANFYSLLEKYFPATDQQMPDMNWGEYVHFSSGAAHTNLKPLATAAFGWTADWDQQLAQAKATYPGIQY